MLNQGGALFTFIHAQQHTIGTYLASQQHEPSS
jgi:hypothetical protein